MKPIVSPVIKAHFKQQGPNGVLSPHGHPHTSAGSPHSVKGCGKSLIELAQSLLEHIQSHSWATKTWANRLENVWPSAPPAVHFLPGCELVGWKQGKKLVDISDSSKPLRCPGALQLMGFGV